MLFAYGDESSDERKQRVFAVGAVFGSDSQWDALRALWLSRTGGKTFHAADCESDAGEYSAMPHQGNLALYKDLVGILVESGLLGYGMAIDLESERRYFANALKDGAYHRAFGEVILYFSWVTHLSVPQDRLEFSFDSRLETNVSAGNLYTWMMAHPEWEPSQQLFDAVKFTTRADVGIQVADLWTREIMKDMDNDLRGSDRRAPRASMSRLLSTGRFSKKLLREDYFVSTDRLIRAFDAEVNSPFHETRYKNWLAQTGVTDSYSVRLRYVQQHDALAKAKGDPTYFEQMQHWKISDRPAQ